MTVIAYVPAYHRGYAEFFAKHEGPIYILDNDLVKKVYPKIERDFRALPAIDIVHALRALWSDVHVLDEEALPKLATDIVMPDEDVSHLFAKKYLGTKKVTFIPTHLRWDSWSSVKESPVPPNRVISDDAFHKEILSQVQDEARKSPDWWRQVGAAIVKRGRVLFIGHNRPNAGDVYSLNAHGDPRSNFDAGVSYDLTTAEHAESHLIALAANQGTALKGADIYVTTFPCPTCAKLIATAGIEKVFYKEGYSLVDAEATLGNAGVEIILVRD
jgi:dCMP deaminase